MNQLILSTTFRKQARKLTQKDKNLKSQLKKSLYFLQKDLTHPSLRLHKLSGVNNWSISVNKSIRIILHQNKNKLYLTRIGTHDQIY